MSSLARILTGRPATDDLDSPIGTDTETTMVPVMVSYSDSARGMRLRLRFDDRELVVDELPRASPLAVPTRMTSWSRAT